ncbi:MAG: ATP-binding protein [Planctomycetota bacterium]
MTYVPPNPPLPFDHAQLLASIVRSSDDAIASKTLDGVLSSWNTAAERLFGYTAAEAIGQPVQMLIPANLRHEEDTILARIRKGERIEHYQSLRLRKDGTTVEVELTISPVYDASGTIVGASKIVRDVSERKRTELEGQRLRRVEQELYDDAQAMNALARVLGGELELQTIAQESVNCATRLADAAFGAFCYDFANERKTACSLFALCGIERAAFDALVAASDGARFDSGHMGAAPVCVADLAAQVPGAGERLPVRSYLAVPIKLRDGDVRGGLFFGHPTPGVFTERAERLALGIAVQAAICIDNARLFENAQAEIAERRAAEERERAARTEAERANRLRDEFLATLSHELRTPLNSILGWTQLLRRAPDDASMRERAIDAIERGARTQTRLIEDLLDMSRVISGKLRLDIQCMDVAPTVEAAIETLRHAAEAKRMRVECMLDPNAGPVVGDATRIQQIVWNLLSNAVKFTPPDGRIEAQLVRVDSSVEIRVSDTGRGISAEFLPHVFDRFRQADSSTTRREGGLGLGLALVKHLTELHGGTVEASSPGEGGGAQFTVRLPIALLRAMTKRDGSRAASATSALPGEPIGARRLSGLTLLVVDDDVNSTEMLQRMLEERGARVGTASGARRALELLDELRPDVLVSDIGMPDMDGYDLIREIRARGNAVPAIAVTAFARAEDRIRALRLGFNAHVAKPLEPQELIEVIVALTL